MQVLPTAVTRAPRRRLRLRFDEVVHHDDSDALRQRPVGSA
jgi:hypothetical protein